jgi:hypothetical protein
VTGREENATKSMRWINFKNFAALLKLQTLVIIQEIFDGEMKKSKLRQ